MTSKSSFFRRCDGVTRRDMIRVGGLTALGIGMGDLFRMRRAAASPSTLVTPKATAKSCILIWLDGGPSHLETFDIKPDAPIEVRGPLEAISTSVPGIHVGECLPHTASMLEKVAIVRSMTSPLGEHNLGAYYMMSGYKPTPVVNYPCFGAVLAQVRSETGILPPNMAVPQLPGGDRLDGGGFLPQQVHPFSLRADPAKADFKVRDMDFYQGLDLARLDRRRDFVNALDRFTSVAESSSVVANDPDVEKALRLMASPEARGAFKLSDEPQDLRDRYGRQSVGQSCLLARRLVERGVSFVTVTYTGWDTHENLYSRLKQGYPGAKVPMGLVPSLDKALSGLITDLDERGMLDETLILVMGEFGRTPKLNTRGGRDHWPRVFSTLLAGGGVRGGQVIGSSDAVGESPKDRPVTPSDLAATIYTLLGVNPKHELHTSDGRPIRVTPFEAEVVSEIVG